MSFFDSDWNKRLEEEKKKQEKEKKKKSKKKKVIKKVEKIIEVEEMEIPPLPQKDPGFPKFSRWLSIPAYKGLFNWQKEHHSLTWESEYEMTLVPRDTGKSVEYTQKYEWAIEYQNYDVLLLGWTDRRKEIAMYVYNFFLTYDLIEVDKRTSPFHFRLKNGGKFDCYLITSKETLGMHSEGEQNRFTNITEEEWNEFRNLFKDFDQEAERVFSEDELKKYVESRKGTNRRLWISIDDPIDASFMKERYKEEILEIHFNSNLYPIHPDKWSFTGTHKFEDDFFDFIEAKFKNELIKYIRSTRYSDGRLLCPERFTHPDLPTFEKDLLEGKRDLQRIRDHVGEYTWHSEYEQNPHPITGEIWDSLEFEDLQDTPINRKYDLCFITIDRATTTKRTSDYTGCIVGFRHMETGIRLITHDFTGYTPLEQLLIRINDFCGNLRDKYSTITVILIVEKQGGGDDFIEMARNRREFLVERDGKITRIKNRIPEVAGIFPIHNVGEKLSRIKNRLYLPIINKRIRFMSYLKLSEIVKELLNFPHSAKLDGVDALATAEFELLKHPLQGGFKDLHEIMKLYQIYEEGQKKDKGGLPEHIRKLGEGKKRYVFE